MPFASIRRLPKSVVLTAVGLPLPFAAAAQNASRLVSALLALNAEAQYWGGAILLLGVGVPALLGWLSYLGLRHWQSRYRARLWPVLLGACVASWLQPRFLLYLFPSNAWFALWHLAGPMIGAWLGWRLTRRPA